MTDSLTPNLQQATPVSQMTNDTAMDSSEVKPSGSNDTAFRTWDLLPDGIDVARVLENVAAECQVSTHDIEDVYPCTPLQSVLMISNASSSKAYICRYKYAVPEIVDVEQLRQAWESVKAAEPVLRNRIVWNDQTRSFIQATIVHKKFPGGFEDKMTFGRDLSKISITRLDGSRNWMFEIRIHHSILDGQSLELVLQKLQKAYTCSVPLLRGPSFRKFISHIYLENRYQNTQSQAFWSGYLEGASVLDFPRLPPVPEHTATTDSLKSFSVQVDLESLVKRCGVSPAIILKAATAIVLGSHAGTTDVIYGLTLSGRDAPIDSIDSMVGPTIATVPFRTQVDPFITIEEYLKNVQKQILDLVPHQQYGLQEIRKISMGAQAACRFRSHVIVQPYDRTATDNDLLKSLPSQATRLIDNMPLSIEFVLGCGQISINCEFDSAYILECELDIMISHLRIVLQSIMTLNLSSELFRVRLADDPELSRNCALVQDLSENLSILSGGSCHTMSTGAIRHGVEGNKRWCIVRQVDEGEIWPAPIFCLGELAVTTHEPLSSGQQGRRLCPPIALNALRLRTGWSFSYVYITDVLGYYDADGNIHIRGNKNQIVTINGHSVNPWDSERRLRLLGGPFANCIVHGVVDKLGTPRLAAFVDVGHGGTEPHLQSLIAEKRLDMSFKEMCSVAQGKILKLLVQPHVPTVFVPVSYIPTTVSGDVDYKSLLSAFNDVTSFTYALVARDGIDGFAGRLPETQCEFDMEAIFQEVFQIEGRLTTSDQFFQLGGDSFTAISLIAAARRRRYDLSISQVFQNPRLGDLANVAMLHPQTASADEVQGTSPSSDHLDFLRSEAAKLCKLTEDEIEDIYPSSAFQAAIAAISFRESADHDKSCYFAKIAYAIPEIIDPCRLSRALEVVVLSNPIFRTRIIHSSEGTMQVVCRPKSPVCYLTTRPWEYDRLTTH